MIRRTAFLPLALLAFVTAATVVGCGSSRSLPSMLPPGASGVDAGVAATDQEASLERTLVQSHESIAGAGDYGVIDGTWYAPEPAPGRLGYFVIDGEAVPGPPNDTGPSGEIAPQSTTPGVATAEATPNCSTFTGNVPPPCTQTGPFRRVYSAPGNSFALAHLALPAKITTMPVGEFPLDGDTGFVYFEGWIDGNPNAGNSEFGFQYSATHNWYTPYYRTNNPVAYKILGTAPGKPIHYLPSTQLTFALAGFTVSTQSYLHVAVIGTTVGTCTASGSGTPTHLCLGHTHTLDAGWSPSGCCILARMTTIGQDAEKAFYDGAEFGPITWSGVELAKTAPAPAPSSTILPLTGKEPPWATAGTQNWPPELNRINVTSATATGEADTINLAKLPKLGVALKPSECQTVKGSGNVAYGASVTGNPGALALKYGWGLFNDDPRQVLETLSVPGGVPDPTDKYLIIGGNSAKVSITGSGPLKPTNWATGIYSYLYFRDATGTLSIYPSALAMGYIQYGSAPRCKT